MLKRSLLFLAGIALTIYVISLFGIEKTIIALLHANIGIIFLAIIVQVAIQCVLVARMMAIAYRRGYLSFRNAFLISQSGMFVNLMTPFTKIGGEPLKIYVLRQFFGTSKASAIVTIDSVVEIISAFLVVLFTTIIFHSELGERLLLIFVVFLVVAFLVLAAVLKLILSPRWINKIHNFLSKYVHRLKDDKAMDHINMFYNAFRTLTKERGLMAGIFGISFVAKLLEFLRMWLIFLALGVSVPVSTIVIVWCIMLVLMMIPWLPGHLGLLEFGLVAAFIAFGIQAEISTSMVVIDRLISFWFVLVIGFASIYISRKSGLMPKFEGKSTKQSPVKKF